MALFYEKYSKQPMVDEKIVEKEALEVRKIYNHYLEERKQKMKKTAFIVERFFGDIIVYSVKNPLHQTK